MNIWMHKTTCELALVNPQWEPINIKFDEKFYLDLDPYMKQIIGTRKIAHGVLVQVGWMLQNQNDLWFGLSLSASENFEDLGEL